MNEQLTLFDDDKKNITSVPIVYNEFKYVEQHNWENLFSGYDELYAITFSSGIKFMQQLINKFEYTEVIFGYEGVLNDGISGIIALETNMIKSIFKSNIANDLSERVDNNSLKLYISHIIKSHEKIYILRSKKGKTRIITGSANMSSSAFTGIQRENIYCYDDNQAAFDYFWNLFINFRIDCSRKITSYSVKKVLEKKEGFGSDIEDIPLYQELKNKKIIYLDENNQDDENVRFITNVQEMSKELKESIPKPKKVQGKITINIDELIHAKKRLNEIKIKQQHINQIYPKLHLEFEKNQLLFNDKAMNLYPDIKNINSDMKIFLDFFNSYDNFLFNQEEIKRKYFLFTNWLFSSIFMPRLRIKAVEYGYSEKCFPVYAILYGKSSGGKSKIVELLIKLMTGNHYKYTESSNFTKNRIDKLKHVMEGVPIYFDDLPKNNYSANYEKIFKDDLWGIEENIQNYAPVIVLSNEIKSITKDISKRVFSCKIDSVIENEIGLTLTKTINDNIEKAGTSLFGHYVNLMISEVEKLEEDMMHSNIKIPDIFSLSASVFRKIVEQCGYQVPSYMNNISYFSYFGDDERGKMAIEKISKFYQSEPFNFKIDAKNNKLIYRFTSESKWDIQNIYNELPALIEPEFNGSTLTMNLTQARKYFGFKFIKILNKYF